MIKTPGKDCPRYRSILSDIRGDEFDGVNDTEAELVALTMLPQADFDRLYEHLQERVDGLYKNSYQLLEQVEELDMTKLGLKERQPGIFYANGVLVIAMKVWDGSESEASTEPGSFWGMVYVTSKHRDRYVNLAMASFNPRD